MKLFRVFVWSFVALSIVLFSSCGSSEQPKEKEVKKEVVKAVDETAVLVEYLEKNGNFVNNKRVPTMIKSSDVQANLNGNYHLIDIRKAGDFAQGHIDGAVNLKMNELLDYFENKIQPASFEKIVMICYSGQAASYATMVLQLLGYDNVYAMKWGMSSWAEDFAAEKWLKKISNKYADKLETTANEKNEKSSLPKLTTGKTTGKEILRERAKNVLGAGFKPVTVPVDKVFENHNDYYIINYWPKEKYDAGHLPGAVQYDPKKSLGTDTYLTTLPKNKTIVTYCYTGQHSAFVTAFLKTLGYDAKSLVYGANSFMNDVLKEKEWHAFSKKQIHNYDLQKSDAPAPSAAAEEEEEVGGC